MLDEKGGQGGAVPAGFGESAVWRSVLLGARATVSAKAAAGNLLATANRLPLFATFRHFSILVVRLRGHSYQPLTVVNPTAFSPRCFLDGATSFRDFFNDEPRPVRTLGSTAPVAVLRLRACVRENREAWGPRESRSRKTSFRRVRSVSGAERR